MNALIREQLPQIIEICKRHRVRRLALFGSALRDDFDPARSDIDLLIDFEPLGAGAHFKTYFDLQFALEDALGRPIDLVESHTLRNPYVKRAVDASRELIYDAA